MHSTDSVSFLTRHTALCPPMPCAEVTLGRLRLAVPPISPYVNPDRPFCPLAALAMHCSDPGSPLTRRTHWGTYVLARVDGENKLLMEVRASTVGFLLLWRWVPARQWYAAWFHDLSNYECFSI